MRRIKANSFFVFKESKKIINSFNPNKIHYIQDKKYSERRIVVTGMGTVNPLGINTSESWNNIKKLNSGIRNLENESFGKELPANCKIGAPIPKHFEAKKFKTLVLISFFF